MSKSNRPIHEFHESFESIQTTPHPLRWTPGKWELKWDEGADLYYIEAEDGQLLAASVGAKNVKFNMTIMAKGPELYAMLREILDNAVVNYVYREKAEKVMAKARGEEVND